MMKTLRKIAFAFALLAALPGPARAAASYFADNVQMTVSGTPGTGTITLGSAVSGHQSASTASIPNGSQVSYYASDSGAVWEIGHGTYSTAGTITRGALWGSSGPGTAVSLTSNALVSVVSIGEDFGPISQASAGVGLAVVSNALNLQPAAASTIGGVESYAGVSHQWIYGISTLGVPQSSQPSFSDISGLLDLTSQVTGTLGVGNGGTGATSLTANFLPKGNGTSPYVASSCRDDGAQFFCGSIFNIQTHPLEFSALSGASVSTGQVVIFDSSAHVIPATTATVDNIIGINTDSVGPGISTNIAFAGTQVCIFDGATTAGDWATISSTVAGDCHDTGSSVRAIGQYQIGQVLSTNASGGTYAVNIENQFTPATPLSGITGFGLNIATALANPVASTTQIWAGTSNYLLDAGQVFNAAGALQALTGTTSVSPDFNTGFNFSFTATSGDNYTLNNPSNMKVGQSGCFDLNQPASGTVVTISFGSDWNFSGGTAPTLTATLGAEDLLCYWVQSSSVVVGTMINNVNP